jgi:hypothetical protein
MLKLETTVRKAAWNRTWWNGQDCGIANQCCADRLPMHTCEACAYGASENNWSGGRSANALSLGLKACTR